jgi:hypothetical protein
MIPVGGAVLAPLVTWFTILAYRAPWLGLPPYSDSAQGIDIWHMQTFWFIAFGIVAALVGERDAWLGCAVFTVGATTFLWGGTIDITHRIVFLGGALLLWAMRHIPAEKKPLAVSLIAAAGVFQTSYLLLQFLGYDVFWGGRGLVGGTGAAHHQLGLYGTLGTVDSATAYVAIVAPLIPWWALPFSIALVLQGHSIGAIAALCAGLLVRYHKNWYLTGVLVGAILAGFAYYYVHIQQWNIPSTVSARIAVWRLALWDLWAGDKLLAWQSTHLITGNGEWLPRVGLLQKKYNVLPTREVFAQAHNEYIQWLYNYGLLGASLLAGWLWHHRTMFRDPMVGACLVALAVASATFFTFQVVSVALLGLVLIGLATPHASQEMA